MKKAAIAFIVVAVIAGAVAAPVAYKKWWLMRPTISNFDSAMKRIVERKFSDPTPHSYGEPEDAMCVRLPEYYGPEQTSQSPHPFRWYVDVLQDVPEAENSDAKLKQLHALAKVGLLVKSDESSRIKGEVRPVSRFRLSSKGWAIVGYGNNSKCFYYGKRTYWGVTGFSRLAANTQPGVDFYVVKAMFGVPAENALAEWARDPAIQAAFPEIRASLKGKEEIFPIARGANRWYQYNPSDPEWTGDIEDPVVLPEAKKHMDEQGAHPPPTVDEIKGILKKQDWLGQGNEFSYTKCMKLPNSDRVDKDLSHRGKYSVAIFPGRSRAPYDRKAQITIPYLDQLEQIGVLKKSSVLYPKENATESDAFENAQIFELTDAYADQLDPQHGCFLLGQPTIEFTDIKIYQPYGKKVPVSWFQYKVRLKFDNAPAWMKDPVLKKAWSELGNVLDSGKACEARYEFDRKTRQPGTGGGSCWWAFDSVQELL